LPLAIIALGVFAGGLAGLSRFGGPQFYSGAPGLGKADRDSLFGRASTVFAFPDVLNFFVHEFAGLRGGRLAFARILPGMFNGLFSGIANSKRLDAIGRREFRNLISDERGNRRS